MIKSKCAPLLAKMLDEIEFLSMMIPRLVLYMLYDVAFCLNVTQCSVFEGELFLSCHFRSFNSKLCHWRANTRKFITQVNILKICVFTGFCIKSIDLSVQDATNL